jgi:hypothetical protein
MAASRQMIDVFAGYNHNLRIGDTEFYDMQNMTSTYYPVLSPRGQRGVYASPDDPQGMIEKDALCYVDGADFYINEDKVTGLILSTLEDDCPKKLISMGAYVIILPDKKWVNTAPKKDDDEKFEYGDIEAEFTTQGSTSFDICKIDGDSYGEIAKSDKAPTIAEDSAEIPLWLDTSTVPHTLKQYSVSNKMWSPIATTYIKISSAGIGKAFSVNDGVTISGVAVDSLQDLNNTMVIWGKGDDYIVVTGIIDVSASQESAITVTRKMPIMDFVIESGNRLWGCRYGTNINGAVVNEIYASKLGDFKNWNCFMGIATDSYAASLGTDGVFTGAINYLGYPLFFKENFLHKVYGNFPANYQIQNTPLRGVQRDCGRSLAIVNETLFYKSRSAICAYDGSLPQEVSYALGEVAYSDAVACSCGNKYYVSMKDSGGIYHLFVYDVAKNMWHKEDNTQVDSFCSCDGELYFIDHADNKIKTMFGSGTKDTTPVKWMAESGVLGTDSPDKKYISRLNVRMSLDIGTRVRFYIQYDSSGTWDLVFSMAGVNLRTFNVPIRPRRCDHMKIRIEGEGEAKIYSITKTIEEGSDM